MVCRAFLVDALARILLDTFKHLRQARLDAVVACTRCTPSRRPRRPRLTLHPALSHLAPSVVIGKVLLLGESMELQGLPGSLNMSELVPMRNRRRE
jgi:hypothetical protein